MAKLKITKAGGDVVEQKITPLVEYAFEKEWKVGYYKALTEDPKQTYIYWLAWKCLSLVEDVPLFGDKFIERLESVEVLADDPNQ
mgnify:CR=1 FL=1